MKIKVLLVVINSFILYSCTSLENKIDFNNIFKDNSDRRDKNVVEIVDENINNDNIIDFQVKDEIAEQIESKEINFNPHNANFYIKDITSNVKNQISRHYNNISNNYKVYMGEILYLPLNDENQAKMINEIDNVSYKLAVENNNLKFMSIYSNNYNILLLNNGTPSRRIKIDVIPKYKIEEKQFYDIIKRNFNSVSEKLEDLITLYRLYYPNGNYKQEIDLIFLKYANTKNDKAIIKEAFNNLKNNFAREDVNTKIELLKAATNIKTNLDIPLSVYTTNDDNLKKELANYLIIKNDLNKNDLLFLEKFMKNNKEDEARIKTILINYYRNNGNIDKVKELLVNSSNIENKQNTIYSNDVNILKREIFKTRDKNKQAEIYYKIANIYLNNGDKIQAKKYFTLIIQQFLNTDLAEKSKQILKNIN